MVIVVDQRNDNNTKLFRVTEFTFRRTGSKIFTGAILQRLSFLWATGPRVQGGDSENSFFVYNHVYLFTFIIYC
jgi:hypothetical protein